MLTHGHEDHIGGCPGFCPNSTFLSLAPSSRWPMWRTSSKSTTSSTTPSSMRSVPGSGSLWALSPSIPSGNPHWLIAWRWPFTRRSASSFTPATSKLTSHPQTDGHSICRPLPRRQTRRVALFQDSTNVDRQGYTPSERPCGLNSTRSSGRPRSGCSSLVSPLRFTASSSQWKWLESTVERSHSSAGRWTIPLRSRRTWDISNPAGLLIHPGEIKNFRRRKLRADQRDSGRTNVSALPRGGKQSQARQDREGRHRHLSSRIIPGNEKSIYRVIDHLLRRDAKVIYDDGSSAPIHVSGHASQEELRLMINLVRPKYFVPYPRRIPTTEAACGTGRGDGLIEKAMLIEDGDVLEIGTPRKDGRVNVGRVCIDSGSRTDVVEDLIIRDRRHLSEDGIVLPIIAINKITGKLENLPEIVIRGMAPAEEGLIAGARQMSCRRWNRRARGKGRLRSHQGEDPHRSEAVHPEEQRRR